MADELDVTSAREVMVSSFVCLFISKNYSTNSHKIRQKGGTRAKKEMVRFWW